MKKGDTIKMYGLIRRCRDDASCRPYLDTESVGLTRECVAIRHKAYRETFPNTDRLFPVQGVATLHVTWVEDDAEPPMKKRG